MKFDFSGWATKNDIVCGDGRIIRQDAFKENDGEIVPLVWNHQHNDVSNVLGHALLRNEKGGVKTYLSFNNTENGQLAKEAVAHGDIRSLSIFANKLKQRGSEVLHGAIREVSLVVAGANPGAKILDSGFAHSEDGGADAWMVFMPDLPLEMYHSDAEDEDEGDDDDYEEDVVENDDDQDDEYEEDAEDGDDDEDYDDSDDGSEDEGDNADDGEIAHSDGEDGSIDPKKIYNSMNEDQKELLHYMVGKALGDSDEEEEEEVKHNLFENEPKSGNVLCHSDEVAIMELAKKSGSFRDALEFYCEQNELQHGDVAPASGFSQDTSVTGNVTSLFPEYHNIGPAEPELITNDQGWISVVLNGVHKSPFSRIRTRQVDIRGIDALRAKGYVKGTKKKLTGNFVLAKRETDPQTIYVKNALHKDDITDITDFDYVAYMYKIDKMMLNEELATAILLGDGRDIGDEDKISEEHIRPVWLDDELYTIHADIDFEAAKEELQGTNTGAYFGDNYIHAEAMVNACLYAREKYKGSGQPVMFIHPHELNIMLLARDMNGRRIYNGVNDIATALNVSKIVTVEQFENKTRVVDNKTKKLLALMLNLSDYSVGSTKGGEVSHFTQFDIDYNQQKSLIETRVSGALIRLWSAIAIEEEVNP